MRGALTACGKTHAAFDRRSIPAETPLRCVLRCVSVEIHPVFLPHAPCQPGASPASALTRVSPQAVNSLWQNPRGVHPETTGERNPRGVRPAIHPGQTAGGGGPVLPVGARPAIHPGQTAGGGTHAAFGQRSIPAEPRRCAPLFVAFRSKYTRYSSLTRLVSRAPRPHRENWPALGAHAGSTTGCSPRRCAPLIVAFRSEYTRYSSLTRLVSRAPRPHRENWPLSALTRVPPPAVNRPGSASFCPGVIRRTDRRCRVPASAGPRAFG